MLIKKNCDHVFLIFFNCHFNNVLLGTLYSIFKLSDPTNTIVFVFIEKKLKKWKLKMSVNHSK